MPSAKSKTKQKPKAVQPSATAEKPEPTPTASWEFEAIGTKWWIAVFEPIAKSQLHELQQAVRGRIATFDRAYSRFRPDSLVTAMSKQAGTYHFPPDGEKLFAFYRQLYDATDGAVTPLIGDVMAAAGYDADYSFRPGTLKKPPSWDEVLRVSGHTITTTQPVLLDFGAAGKGYLVDLVGDVLRAAGLQQFCVDAGGDMIAFGHDALRIGLEHPDNTSQIIGVANLRHGALCGSAGNRRVWQEYHHIMNPFTLRPARDIKAAWVTAADALTADGLTTALFFVSPGNLRQFQFEYVAIDAHNRVACSPHFAGTIFTRSDDAAHD